MGFGEQTEDRRLEETEPFFVVGGIDGGMPGYWVVDRRRSLARVSLVYPDDTIGCQQAHWWAESANAAHRDAAKSRGPARPYSAARYRVDPQVSDWHSAAAADLAAEELAHENSRLAADELDRENRLLAAEVAQLRQDLAHARRALRNEVKIRDKLVARIVRDALDSAE